MFISPKNRRIRFLFYTAYFQNKCKSSSFLVASGDRSQQRYNRERDHDYERGLCFVAMTVENNILKKEDFKLIKVYRKTDNLILIFLNKIYINKSLAKYVVKNETSTTRIL